MKCSIKITNKSTDANIITFTKNHGYYVITMNGIQYKNYFIKQELFGETVLYGTFSPLDNLENNYYLRKNYKSLSAAKSELVQLFTNDYFNPEKNEETTLQNLYNSDAQI